MDFSSLDIFCAVAEEGSITRAAQRLERVPSNVSTRIQQLEEQVQAALFQREGKRMILTAEGERFLGYARQLSALAREALAAVDDSKPSGQLRLGSMEATAASRLPGPLAAFHQQWPAVSVHLSTGTTATLLEDVAQHRIDCALVALPQGQTLDAHLSGVPLWHEQLMLVAPKDAAGEALSLAAFAPGCTYRAVGEAWLRQSSPKGVRVIEANSYHAIMASVAAGNCIGVMPQSVLDLYQGSNLAFTTRPLQEMDTWLVWRVHYRSAALAAFRALCDRHV